MRRTKCQCKRAAAQRGQDPGRAQAPAVPSEGRMKVAGGSPCPGPTWVLRTETDPVKQPGATRPRSHFPPGSTFGPSGLLISIPPQLDRSPSVTALWGWAQPTLSPRPCKLPCLKPGQQDARNPKPRGWRWWVTRRHKALAARAPSGWQCPYAWEDESAASWGHWGWGSWLRGGRQLREASLAGVGSRPGLTGISSRLHGLLPQQVVGTPD